MIYFAHSTMLLYDKSIVSRDDMTPEEFYYENTEVMKRVFDEGMNIMEYELSYNQMMKACYTYLCGKYRPQSVHETEAYVLKTTQ
jgi:hypothetical protein